MNIGQKIKALRVAKVMTQQELAGDNITRNMLSRIENGFALPSMQTLLYISEKLGVPAGYLISDDSEEFSYKKIIGMPEVMRAFHASEWQICSDLCKNLGGYDSEINYILAICEYNIAKEHFENGDLKQFSIFADGLVQKGSSVVHGKIKEVSIVLSGANKGARIENLNFAHSDGTYDTDDEEAIIYTAPQEILIHSDSEDNMEDDDMNGNQTLDVQAVLDAGYLKKEKVNKKSNSL